MTCIILATPLVQKSRQPSNPTIGSLSFSSACGLVAVAGLPTNAHLEDVWLPGIFQKRRPPSSLESPSRKEAPKKLLRLIKHGVSFCIFFSVQQGRSRSRRTWPKRKVHRFFWFFFGWSLFLDSNPNVLTQEWSGRVLRGFFHAYAVAPTLSKPKKEPTWPSLSTGILKGWTKHTYLQLYIVGSDMGLASYFCS